MDDAFTTITFRVNYRKGKEMIDKCIACQAVGNRPEPMKIAPAEDRLWTTAAIDFYGLIPGTGQYIIVVIDTHYKFS